jgi:hypothetical protein
MTELMIPRQEIVALNPSITSAKEDRSMTSPNAPDANDCQGCPEGEYPSAPSTPLKSQMTDPKELFAGLPGETTSEPLPELEGVIYSEIFAVDQGMFAEGHLVQVVLTIPGQPEHIRCHPDGAIEYKKGVDDFEPPTPLDGFRRDPENLWLFRPLWESCSWRHYTTMLKTKCQCIDVLAKCSVNGHRVKYKDCLRCRSRLPIPNYTVPEEKTRASLRFPNLDRNSK